jgi:hypothetical protein
MHPPERGLYTHMDVSGVMQGKANGMIVNFFLDYHTICPRMTSTSISVYSSALVKEKQQQFERQRKTSTNTKCLVILSTSK